MDAHSPITAPEGLPAPPASLSASRSSSLLHTPHSFPCSWLCSTCGATHSVLEILSESNIRCSCENPTLQAVYDQFGRIFLYWRNDPAIVDLRDLSSVREAAWRVGEAAGGQAEWLRQVLGGRGLSARLSQSSLSSNEDAEDMEISE